MANDYRLRGNFLSGAVTDNPLLVGATTLNSAGLAALPVVDAMTHLALTLDPSGAAGAPEIIYVTAHASLATAATIVRAREGTGARQHAQNVQWINAPTALDYPSYRLPGQDRLWTPPAAPVAGTASALNDEFNDGSLDAAWTRVDANANSCVYIEGNDLLSINSAAGDAATSIGHALVRSIGSLAPPLTFEAAFRMFRRYATNYQMFGLCMTSGITTAATAITMRPYGNTGIATAVTLSGGRHNTIATGESTGLVSPEIAMEYPGGILYQRLRWVSANTFEFYWSGDGVGWFQYPAASFACTITPTYAGVAMSSWGGANRMFGAVEYFRVTAT